MGLGIVSTKYGKLKGIFKQNYTVFRGIPYAEPPVGELRWKSPREPKPWEGVRKAERFGKRCSQGNPIQPGTLYYKEFYNDEDFIPEMSEDCLFLNIWTPAESGNEKLPVAFWIHGGAFSGGNGSEMEFDGAAYCAHGVILVTINYRLGLLAFMAHPELSLENEKKISGNYGILDQIAALKWVYENIAEFGGDPQKIMIFGQSAGAMSVQTLVSSSLTEGMISCAIMQSGAGFNGSLSNDVFLSDAEKQGEDIIKFSGHTSIEEMRKLTGEEIVKLAFNYERECGKRGSTGLLFAPCIDGFILKQGYNVTLENGLHHSIPYIIGSTANDITGTNESLKENEKGILYYGGINWSIQDEKLGRKPDYVYYFDRRPLGDDAGAFHSCELWYMFGTLTRSWRPKEREDYTLSERMVTYWCNFAKYNDPNGKGLPVWNSCSSSKPSVMELH